MPDWRDLDAYPEPDEISILGWRWEFLRRNPKYRRDWSRDESTFINPDWIEDQGLCMCLESKDRYFEREYRMVGAIDATVSMRDHRAACLAAKEKYGEGYMIALAKSNRPAQSTWALKLDRLVVAHFPDSNSKFVGS